MPSSRGPLADCSAEGGMASLVLVADAELSARGSEAGCSLTLRGRPLLRFGGLPSVAAAAGVWSVEALHLIGRLSEA